VPSEPENGTKVTGTAERPETLCRTCLHPITWETRAVPGLTERTGWYDDTRSDQIICFSAVSYRHEPLTDHSSADETETVG